MSLPFIAAALLLHGASADLAGDISSAISAASDLSSQVNAWSSPLGLNSALGIQGYFPTISSAVVAIQSDVAGLTDSAVDVPLTNSFGAAVAGLLQSLTAKAADFQAVLAGQIVQNDLISLGAPAVAIVDSIINAVQGDCAKITALTSALNDIESQFASANSAYSASQLSFAAAPTTCNAAASGSSSAVVSSPSIPASVSLPSSISLSLPTASASIPSSAPVSPSVSPSVSISTTSVVDPGSVSGSSSVPLSSSSVRSSSAIPTSVSSMSASASPTTITTVVNGTTITTTDCGCTESPTTTPGGPAGTTTFTTVVNGKTITTTWCSTSTGGNAPGPSGPGGIVTVSNGQTITVSDCSCTETGGTTAPPPPASGSPSSGNSGTPGPGNSGVPTPGPESSSTTPTIVNGASLGAKMSFAAAAVGAVALLM